MEEEPTKTDLQQAVESFQTGGSSDTPQTPGDDSPPLDAPTDPDSGGLFGRLDPWATEPHKPLNGIEPPWDIERGGLPRIARGLAKIGIPLDQPPGIVDLGIGLVEELYKNGNATDSGESGEEERFK